MRNKLEFVAPKRLTEVAEYNLTGVSLTEGVIALKLRIEDGICTEDAVCNLIGESLILSLLMSLIRIAS